MVGWRLTFGAPWGFAHRLVALLPVGEDLLVGHVGDDRLEVVIGFGHARSKRRMGEHVGAGFLAQLGTPAEVVGMGVGDDCGVHPSNRDLGRRKPVGERSP